MAHEVEDLATEGLRADAAGPTPDDWHSTAISPWLALIPLLCGLAVLFIGAWWATVVYIITVTFLVFTLDSVAQRLYEERTHFTEELRTVSHKLRISLVLGEQYRKEAHDLTIVNNVLKAGGTPADKKTRNSFIN